MKIKISKSRKFLYITPTPKESITGAIRVYFNRTFSGQLPFATCDMNKGQSRYYFGDNLIDRVFDCDFAKIKEGNNIIFVTPDFKKLAPN